MGYNKKPPIVVDIGVPKDDFNAYKTDNEAYHAENSLQLALMGVSVQNKLFGAIGDGVAIDTVAIQNAINYVSAQGGILYFPAGIYLINATLVLPVDRVIKFVGAGQMLIEGSTPLLNGTVLKRAVGFVDTMFAPTGTSSAANKGAQFSNLSFTSNRQAGNLFEIDWINVMQFDCVTFHRIAGHAIRAYSLYNSWFRACRFYGCGDATHEVVLLDGSLLSNSATAGVHFIDCTWENNYGTELRLTRNNAPTTAGTSDIKVIGGKMEQSLGTPPGLPLCIIEATAHSEIKTLFANGKHYDATHLKIGGTTNTNIIGLAVDSQFIVADTTLTLNPRYLVDILADATGSVSNVIIKGQFRHGGADGGAQIRIGTMASTKLSRIYIDPTNVYHTSYGKVIEGVYSGVGSISADRGNASIAITYGLDAETQLWNTELTADRVCTINKVAEGNSNYPQHGAKFKIVRTATGAFNLNLINGSGGTTIKALPANSWAEVVYNGADWILTSYGVL